MSTDKKGTKILAHTFFAQLQAGGYTHNQIVEIATELIDQVTCNLRDVKVDATTLEAPRVSA